MKLKSTNYQYVIVIGNGFDLNLGLETSYPDFVKSTQFNNLVSINNKLSRYLNEIHTLKNWIDIENELKKYSISGANKNDDFFDEFKNLSNKLMDYLKTIDYDKINISSPAFKLIENVKDYKVLIIDFNYTSSIQYIFKKLNINLNDRDSNIEHVKIHGSIESGEIVFGVEDKAIISPDHVFLKKSVNKHFNAIDFSKAFKLCNHLIFFGHSLGETDHMYFDEYFRNVTSLNSNIESKDILIYYFGEKSYYNIHSQLDALTIKSINKLKQYNSFKMIDIESKSNF